MAESQGAHMTPEEFRRHGHALIDWLADYHTRVAELPVRPSVEPGDVRAALPAHPPEHGEAFADVLSDLDEVIVPGLTHWQHPSFFGYFPANASGPSILGELAAAGLGVQGMLWETSPAVTELETHVLDWLAELLDLPARFLSHSVGGGVLQDSASSATLCALLAARERATDGAATSAGVDRALAVYASAEAHSSVEKAVRIAGLGTDALRLIDVDERYAMRPESLARQIAADRADGVLPCLVVATVGTTSSTAMDPLRATAEICGREGLWLHVDAAMSGVAAVAPEHRGMHDGLELADSYCTNPHKWLLTNFDCDAFWVADRAPLLRALSVVPEYLRTAASEGGTAIDYRDWQVPLGRRFRALKLWFVLRHYGAEGLRAHIRHHVALAAELASWVEAHPDFELTAPVPQNLVCFHHRDGDERTARLRQTLNDSGELYLTHTRLDGRYTLRMAIGGVQTQREHVAAAWEAITTAASEPT